MFERRMMKHILRWQPPVTSEHDYIYYPCFTVDWLNGCLSELSPGLSISVVSGWLEKNDVEVDRDGDLLLVEGQMNGSFEGDPTYNHPSIKSFLRRPGILDCQPRKTKEKTQWEKPLSKKR